MRKKSKVDSGAGITKPELSKAISMAKSSQSSQEDTSEIPSWVKLDKRHPQQLKHDMKVLKYLIRGSLPFNHVKRDQAFDEFCKSTELRKYWIKDPTTYSKAKLPLLYNQVVVAVNAQMKRDMPGTLGFSFTADLWSSRY